MSVFTEQLSKTNPIKQELIDKWIEQKRYPDEVISKVKPGETKMVYFLLRRPSTQSEIDEYSKMIEAEGLKPNYSKETVEVLSCFDFQINDIESSYKLYNDWKPVNDQVVPYFTSIV